MKIEIDFEKKEVILLEPTKLSEILERFKQIGIEDFTIVSAESKQILTWYLPELHPFQPYCGNYNITKTDTEVYKPLTGGI